VELLVVIGQVLEVHLQPHALGGGIVLDDVVDFLRVLALPRLPPKVLLQEIAKVALELQPELVVVVHHGCG
jgi:hypothetical protein